jgi:hypothetical protein
MYCAPNGEKFRDLCVHCGLFDAVSVEKLKLLDKFDISKQFFAYYLIELICGKLITSKNLNFSNWQRDPYMINLHSQIRNM